MTAEVRRALASVWTDREAASLYRYRFTTRAERRESGATWVRAEVGEYLPPTGLQEPSV